MPVAVDLLDELPISLAHYFGDHTSSITERA